MNGIPPLFHFTCQHGRAALGERAVAKPALALFRQPVHWSGHWVWFTTDPEPSRVEVGLTSETLGCDPMAHRYRLDDPDPSDVLPWTYFRTYMPDLFKMLDHDGAKPETWWVSPRGVTVVSDPIRVTQPRKANQ